MIIGDKENQLVNQNVEEGGAYWVEWIATNGREKGWNTLRG